MPFLDAVVCSLVGKESFLEAWMEDVKLEMRWFGKFEIG
jgi:hypothetical protein